MMHVLKRNGKREPVRFDKISNRINFLCYGLDRNFVDHVSIAITVINGLYPGVRTRDLDILAAETAASLITTHPDYGVLAARIVVSNLHKETNEKFSDVFNSLYTAEDSFGKKEPIVSEFYHGIVMRNKHILDEAIEYSRDYDYSYFGLKTLEKSYLLKIDGRIVERPQHMLMRVAVGIHGEDIEAAIETYNYMSCRFFTHASPTMFAAATIQPQMSSCFLMTIIADSIEGIFQSVGQCAMISKSAGGIGINVHKIRAKGTEVTGTNGKSNGLVPMLRVFNNVARYVDQGGGKRMGAFAIYLEPWHADIFEFLDLRKNTGKEENRARDLFYGLWVPDLFMKRVETDGVWSLMCPHKCPGLDDVWGEEFEKLYTRYELEGRANKTIKARMLWSAIVEAQVETGNPYMLYKDACNRKSNQQNIGTIRSSNLCAEIVEYSSPDEIAVCNLASIALNAFIKPNKSYDFVKLKQVTKIITKNLNKIIDNQLYPVPEARVSNMRHRPIGIGVQGLADTFIMMRLPYDSQEAAKLNQQIFETIYYGALEASSELAKVYGAYESYPGSPASKGILQYDMWNKNPTDLWDWGRLKQLIKDNGGLRNSLLVAPMPTASTAQILGNNESFEPYTSNIYTRRVLSGEFQVVNQHLVVDLIKLGLWDAPMKNEIISYRGSIQNITRIPQELRDLYKTVWELSVKTLINMAVDRGAFVDQSQSFNIHVAEPDYGKMTSIHFYGWRRGLKTGMYYLRTKPAANAIQFTLDNTKTTTAESSDQTCSRQNGDACLSCGS